MVQFQEVTDSLCVGQRFSNNTEERVILFLKMADGGDQVPADLVKRIAVSIRARLSARHVPALILPIADIPYTVNGKKVNYAAYRVSRRSLALFRVEKLNI